MDERETRRSQRGVALVSIYEKGKERREWGGRERKRRGERRKEGWEERKRKKRNSSK